MSANPDKFNVIDLDDKYQILHECNDHMVVYDEDTGDRYLIEEDGTRIELD